MSQSLLSETGYIKEDQKMMEDDVTLEEELLKIEDNREINPDHKLKDKEECGEASKREQLRERTQRNAATKTHQRYPPKSGLKEHKRQ